MINFLAGAVIGGVIVWAVMKYVSPTLLKDKITGEVTTIIHNGRTFVDSAARKVGL